MLHPECYTSEQWYDLLDTVCEESEEIGFVPSYNDGDTVAHRVEQWFYGNGEMFSVELETAIRIKQGYYEAASIGYDVKAWVNGNDCGLLSRLSEEGLADRIMECLANTTVIGKHDGWNMGLVKSHWPKIRRGVERKLGQTVEQMEKFCEKFSEEIYRRVGSFSNGEAIYEKVS